MTLSQTNQEKVSRITVARYITSFTITMIKCCVLFSLFSRFLACNIQNKLKLGVTWGQGYSIYYLVVLQDKHVN